MADEAIAALERALTAAQPAQAGEIGSEWQACVKLPVTVHVRKQRQGEAHVSTREGITPIKPDDLIMRGVSGEEYPIGRDIFEQTYRLAPTQPAAQTDSMGMPTSCGKPLCLPDEHHPLCKLHKPAAQATPEPTTPQPLGYIPTDAIDQIKTPPRLITHKVPVLSYAAEGYTAIYTHPAPGVPMLARSLSEWNEDDGPVMWWAWNGEVRGWAGESAYIGSPLCDDWPGYHTHWTPHPPQPALAAAQAKGGGNG